MSKNGFMDWITVPDKQGKEHQLGFDGDGTLYWDNKRVLTEQKVRLPWLVNWMIVFGGASTVVLAVMAVLEYCRG